MEKNIENDNYEKAPIYIKIPIIGKDMTGKTIFFSINNNNFSYKKKFESEYLPTAGAQYFRKEKTINNFEYVLEFWDTFGHEKYKALNKIFYKDADIILMFYNSLDKNSFKMIKEHFRNIKEYCSKDPICALIRGKYDLNIKSNEYKDIITDEEALEFTDENNIIFFHLSNFEKYENGVNNIITSVLKEYIKRKNLK